MGVIAYKVHYTCIVTIIYTSNIQCKLNPILPRNNIQNNIFDYFSNQFTFYMAVYFSISLSFKVRRFMLHLKYCFLLNLARLKNNKKQQKYIKFGYSISNFLRNRQQKKSSSHQKILNNMKRKYILIANLCLHVMILFFEIRELAFFRWCLFAVDWGIISFLLTHIIPFHFWLTSKIIYESPRPVWTLTH